MTKHQRYTIMDRHYSWFDNFSRTDHLLTHEMYHLKITELGTQLLNDAIKRTAQF